MDAPLVGVDMNQAGWFYATGLTAAKMQTNPGIPAPLNAAAFAVAGFFIFNGIQKT